MLDYLDYLKISVYKPWITVINLRPQINGLCVLSLVTYFQSTNVGYYATRLL
jgi:hypothetical protein